MEDRGQSSQLNGLRVIQKWRARNERALRAFRREAVNVSPGRAASAGHGHADRGASGPSGAQLSVHGFNPVHSERQLSALKQCLDEFTSLGELVLSRLECVICLSLCQDAVELSCCGAIGCDICISRVTTCPVCREPIVHPIQPSAALRRLIASAQVVCPQPHCRAELTLATIASHRCPPSADELSPISRLAGHACPQHTGHGCGSDPLHALADSSAPSTLPPSVPQRDSVARSAASMPAAKRPQRPHRPLRFPSMVAKESAIDATTTPSAQGGAGGAGAEPSALGRAASAQWPSEAARNTVSGGDGGGLRPLRRSVAGQGAGGGRKGDDFHDGFGAAEASRSADRGTAAGGVATPLRTTLSAHLRSRSMPSPPHPSTAPTPPPIPLGESLLAEGGEGLHPRTTPTPPTSALVGCGAFGSETGDTVRDAARSSSASDQLDREDVGVAGGEGAQGAARLGEGSGGGLRNASSDRSLSAQSAGGVGRSEGGVEGGEGVHQAPLRGGGGGEGAGDGSAGGSTDAAESPRGRGPMLLSSLMSPLRWVRASSERCEALAVGLRVAEGAGGESVAGDPRSPDGGEEASRCGPREVEGGEEGDDGALSSPGPPVTPAPSFTQRVGASGGGRAVGAMGVTPPPLASTFSGDYGLSPSSAFRDEGGGGGADSGRRLASPSPFVHRRWGLGEGPDGAHVTPGGGWPFATRPLSPGGVGGGGNDPYGGRLLTPTRGALLSPGTPFPVFTPPSPTNASTRCTYCAKVVTLSALPSHVRNDCMKATIRCQRCKKLVARKHSCLYAKLFGCTEAEAIRAVVCAFAVLCSVNFVVLITGFWSLSVLSDPQDIWTWESRSR